VRFPMSRPSCPSCRFQTCEKDARYVWPIQVILDDPKPSSVPLCYPVQSPSLSFPLL
jgi:hypothetical protein